jgi:phosphoglycerate dehydrogenase-like enzyme
MMNTAGGRLAPFDGNLAVTVILTLNRKIHRAHARVRAGDFALAELLGFDLKGCTVGAQCPRLSAMRLPAEPCRMP